jgi:CxxC motif-containing protein (DUF1111 family)
MHVLPVNLPDPPPKKGNQMSKRFVFSSIFFSLAAALFVLSASPALAVKEFKDAFKSKYVKPDSTDPNDKALAAAFDKAGCATCHVGDNRKNRNDYGKQLAKLIKKSDKKNKDKIFKAMDKVAEMKSKPKDTSSPTFGEKIAGGKLPAAN